MKKADFKHGHSSYRKQLHDLGYIGDNLTKKKEFFAIMDANPLFAIKCSPRDAARPVSVRIANYIWDKQHRDVMASYKN